MFFYFTETDSALSNPPSQLVVSVFCITSGSSILLWFISCIVHTCFI